jgi:NAD-dependent dihydropyrimidine dehydrogenase PreA subunit
MFIEKLKDETLRKKYEFKRDSYRKLMAGEDMSGNRMTQVINELAPKVVAHTLALKEPRIIPVGRTVEAGSVALPMEILEHFIKKSTHRFILNFCICRDIMDCKDYPIDVGCMFLGEGAMQLNPELGRLASVEEALEHARKWQDLGLICNLGYVPFDSALLEVDPPEQFMSVCGCCPCCCITTKVPADRLEGVEVLVSADDCTACGSCLEECVYNGVQIIDDKAVTTDGCVACGRCVNACPEDAIEIRILDSAYVDKTIQRFNKVLDVTVED